MLKRLDLQGKIVTGDALLTQRKLSRQIVEAGGAYVFPVKDNQPQLLHDIPPLFAPEPCIKGFSPAPKDLRSAHTLEKGHGRLERRTLTASGDLKGYVNWPYAEQVFQLEREFQQLNTGQVTREVAYGVSSLTPAEADAARLLAITRRHWSIESGLHYRRDGPCAKIVVGYAPDRPPQVLAAINNLVLGIFARLGYTCAPAARRHFAAHLDEAINVVLRALH